MSEQRPPFRMLSGGFSFGKTSEEAEFWVFDDGKWEVRILPPQEGVYFAHTVAGRSLKPFMRLSDVQEYQEWQAFNGVKPSPDEWWAGEDWAKKL